MSGALCGIVISICGSAQFLPTGAPEVNEVGAAQDILHGKSRVHLSLSALPASRRLTSTGKKAVSGIIFVLTLTNNGGGRTLSVGGEDIDVFLPHNTLYPEPDEVIESKTTSLACHPWRLFASADGRDSVTHLDGMAAVHPRGRSPVLSRHLKPTWDSSWQTLVRGGSLRSRFFVNSTFMKTVCRRSGATSRERTLKVQAAVSASFLKSAAPRLRRELPQIDDFGERVERRHEILGKWWRSLTHEIAGRSNVLEFYLDADDRIVMSLEPHTPGANAETPAGE